ncbi:MAG TPA: SAM-dependent methyltransferase [Anaerolineales bacterium]|nr:SAM-dependent methyltransferase [Anaerolineales bacterium]
MTEITLKPIGYVRNTRLDLDDDHWGNIVSEIVLDESLPEESLDGIETFSHAEIIFHFHRAVEVEDMPMVRNPRGNPRWPKVGILAQRNKDRPNHIGLTIVTLVKREGRSLFVQGLDAVDGTPVLDIKPVMREFLPRAAVRQPGWSHELMQGYWE